MERSAVNVRVGVMSLVTITRAFQRVRHVTPTPVTLPHKSVDLRLGVCLIAEARACVVYRREYLHVYFVMSAVGVVFWFSICKLIMCASNDTMIFLYYM